MRRVRCATVTNACDPGADDWLRNFFIVDDGDGSLTVVWNPAQVDGDDADDQFVRFIDAGDSLHDVVRTLREFSPHLTVKNDDDNDDDDTEGSTVT